jgi:hypothetical protein
MGLDNRPPSITNRANNQRTHAYEYILFDDYQLAYLVAHW